LQNKPALGYLGFRKFWRVGWMIRLHTMNHFRKRFFLLVLTQTVCLAVGLWLEQRFVSSLAPSESQQNKSATEQVTNESVVSNREKDTTSAFPSATGGEIPAIGVRAMALAWIAMFQAIVAYLILVRDQEETSRKHRKAEKISQQQNNELLRTRDAVIFGLAKLTESRDPETGNHLERIAIYSTRLATAVRRDPRYRSQVTPSFVKLIGISSALHDIGKVGIRDAILLKPGKLERQERPLMELHVEIGSKCIREIELRLGSSNFLQMAREIAHSHHERWDGSGYPKGLSGKEIPLSARIVAIADVYDALSTQRIYRDAIPHEKCVDMIRQGAGRQFDPVLVEIFLKLESEFRDIAQSYRDVHKSVNGGPASTNKPLDIALETDISIDDNFAVIQDLLVLCAGDSPTTANQSREDRNTLAPARLSCQYPVTVNSEKNPPLEELEPKNVP
jgi:HD-GYP domain-containing protein (c-di-GMP phosphodiesterase class II)